jgi:hypothetical protein
MNINCSYRILSYHNNAIMLNVLCETYYGVCCICPIMFIAPACRRQVMLLSLGSGWPVLTDPWGSVGITHHRRVRALDKLLIGVWTGRKGWAQVLRNDRAPACRQAGLFIRTHMACRTRPS